MAKWSTAFVHLIQDFKSKPIQVKVYATTMHLDMMISNAFCCVNRSNSLVSNLKCNTFFLGEIRTREMLDREDIENFELLVEALDKHQNDLPYQLCTIFCICVYSFDIYRGLRVTRCKEEKVFIDRL